MDQRLLVLDTQVFKSLNLNFNHPQLQRLLELKKDCFFRLALPRMVDLEIIEKIKEDVAALDEKFNKQAHLKGFFDIKPVSLDQATKNAIDEYDKFKDRFDIELLEHEDIKCKEIVELYINKLPPFSQKKKSEFPDAISLLSIDKSAYKKIDVISNDPDWKEYCECHSEMKSYESIPKYIDARLSEVSRYMLELKNKILLPHNLEAIVDYLKEHVERSFQSNILLHKLPQNLNFNDLFNFRVDDVNITGIKESTYGSSCWVHLRLLFDVYVEGGRKEEAINGKLIELPIFNTLTLEYEESAIASLKETSITSLYLGQPYNLEFSVKGQS